MSRGSSINMTKMPNLKATPIQRNQDELEGALLLPDCSRVHATAVFEIHPAVAATAIPDDYFQYDYLPSSTTESSDRLFLEEVADASLPTAPALPYYNDNTGKLIEEKRKLRKAQENALIKADQELTNIERANRRIFPSQYYAEQDVKFANEAAKRRNMEGITVLEDKYHKPNCVKGEERIVDDSNLGYSNVKGGGYEVSNYDTTDYSGMTYDSDYEYKSVYDT